MSQTLEERVKHLEEVVALLVKSDELQTGINSDITDIMQLLDKRVDNFVKGL